MIGRSESTHVGSPGLVSVVIPAFNEEKRIGDSLRTIAGYFARRAQPAEIIVVDDGSTDGTREIVLAAARELALPLHCLVNARNGGKGYSVKRGMLEARGQILLFTDADLSTPIEEFAKLEQALTAEGHDVAIGSRRLSDSNKPVPQGMVRDRMGALFALFVRTLLLKDISDSQCGFKCFTRACARTVFPRQTIDGYGFDPEILCLVKAYRYRLKEVPVSWSNSANSKLRYLPDAPQIGYDLVKIKVKSLLGHYSP